MNIRARYGIVLAFFMCVFMGINALNVLAKDNTIISSNDNRIENELEHKVGNTYSADDDNSLLDEKIEFTHLYPSRVTLYKNSNYTSPYENVSYHIEDGRMIVVVPYSVSANNLRNACIDFKIESGEWHFTEYTEDISYVVSDNIAEDISYVISDNTVDDINNVISGNIAKTNDDGNAKIRSNYVDLTRKPVMNISMDDGRSEEYVVEVKYLTGDLPVLYLSTASGYNVESRDEYEEAKLVIDDTEYDIEIKGRGNVSWWGYPQKGYVIKLDKKRSLFGFAPSEKYSLVSTYGDSSLVRNVMAMEMASVLDNMEYVPKQRNVDVFINGNYRGVYTFSEKIDVAAEKVNLFSAGTYDESVAMANNDDPYDDLAFLIELGGYSKEGYGTGLNHFYMSHVRDAYIKYPDEDKLNQDTSQRIKNYIRDIDNSIMNGTYDKYLETDSWVDWFIIMEYSNNTDSAFCRSTYMYKRPGSGLYLGPIWDFDKAFANYGMDNPDYDTWCSAESDYEHLQFSVIHYLYMSDAFMKRVQKRWDAKKDVLKEIGLDTLDNVADDSAFSRQYNEKLYGYSGTYMLTRIRNFMNTRYRWIDSSLHSDNYNRNPDRPTIKWNEDKELEIINIVDEEEE